MPVVGDRFGNALVWNEAVISVDENRSQSIKRRKTETDEVAFEPDGGSRIGIPDFPALNFRNSSFTASLWFRATAMAATQNTAMMLSHGNFKHASGWGVGMLAGGNVFCAVGSVATPFRATHVAMAATLDTFADDRYHHVSCVFDPSVGQLRLAIDGNPVHLRHIFPYEGGEIKIQGTLKISSLPELVSTAPQMPLVIGASYTMASEFFDGDISEIRIWNIARTPEQESQEMFDVLSDTSNPHLVAYIPLNDCDSHMPYTRITLQLRGNQTLSNVPVLNSPVNLLFVGDRSHVPACTEKYHPLVPTPEY